MKVVALLLSACFVCYHNLPAQTANNYLVKAGEDIKDVLSKEIYYYPSFIPGTVFFRGGASAGGRLNYNRLIGEMQFIDPKGDTLAIDNEKTISYITIDKDSFYYDQGYLRLLIGNGSARLAAKELLRVIDKQKIGAYGAASPLSAIDSYKSYSDGRRAYRLDVREDMIYSKETFYYLGDKFNHFLFANKKNLFKMFSKHENDIEKYLREYPLNFNKEEDMKKLVAFLQTL